MSAPALRPCDSALTLGLNITANALRLVRLLLNGCRGCFGCRRSGMGAPKEHVREAVADGRANSDRTRCCGHLCEHARALRCCLRLGLGRNRGCVVSGWGGTRMRGRRGVCATGLLGSRSGGGASSGCSTRARLALCTRWCQNRRNKASKNHSQPL